MLLGYLMNDLLREYVASGEFTRRGKWLAALREAAMFYVPALLIGMGCASALPSRDPPAIHAYPTAPRVHAARRFRVAPSETLPQLGLPARPPAHPPAHPPARGRFVVYMMIHTGARLARLDAAAPCT